MRGEFQRAPSLRRRRFVEEYLACDDPRTAAIAAGYSKRSAKVQACLLMRDPWIVGAIRAKLDSRAERTRIGADRIVEELGRIAFSDIGRFAEWGGDEGWVLRPAARIAEADRAAIARIVKRGDALQVVLHDKIRALDALGKYYKLWGRHADKFGGRGALPFGANMRDEPQLRAREALKKQIEKMLAERDEVDHEAMLREEAEWAEAWKGAFG